MDDDVTAASQDAQELVLERPGAGVVTARINRPAARNALNTTLRAALAQFFVSVAETPDIRCVVLAGGVRAFCAGADLNDYADAGTIDILKRNMGLQWDAIARCPVPVIAAVRGYALGGGCELAMHADIVVAGESAVFGQPEIKVGLMPGGGATQRLARAIGKARAMDVLLTGATLSASEALAAGLISRVVPDDNVEDEAQSIAKAIANGPGLASRLIKEAVLASMSCSLETGLALERRSFQNLFSSSDKTVGIRAFLEKRKPEFGQH